LDIVEKNQKPFLKIRESLPFLYKILNGAQNFQFIGFIFATLKWLNIKHFSEYKYKKYKIRLVSIIGKREDQALISISTILKFSAQKEEIKKSFVKQNQTDPTC